jgi:hypothetical protein
MMKKKQPCVYRYQLLCEQTSHYTIGGFKSTLKKWLDADLVLSLKEPSEALQGIGIVYSQAVDKC